MAEHLMVRHQYPVRQRDRSDHLGNLVIKRLEFLVIRRSGSRHGVGIKTVDVGDQERRNAIDCDGHAGGIGEEMRICTGVIVPLMIVMTLFTLMVVLALMIVMIVLAVMVVMIVMTLFALMIVMAVMVVVILMVAMTVMTVMIMPTLTELDR